MSMHKKPLTKLEHDGLLAHGLDIGTPSQLSDVFRQGIEFTLANAHTVQREGWVSVPIEPTHDMLSASLGKFDEGGTYLVYQAMIQAAPTDTE